LAWHTATRTVHLFLAPAFLWVVLAYAGVSHRRTVQAVAVTTGLTVLVAAAYGWLFWTDGVWAAVDQVVVGDVLLLRVERTPLGWAFVAYVYAVLVGSFLVLVRLYRSTGRVSRRQVGVFTGAAVVPTVANLVYVRTRADPGVRRHAVRLPRVRPPDVRRGLRVPVPRESAHGPVDAVRVAVRARHRARRARPDRRP
jgi:hypothetical protein